MPVLSRSARDRTASTKPPCLFCGGFCRGRPFSGRADVLSFPNEPNRPQWRRLCGHQARWCHNRGAKLVIRCLRPRLTTFSWMGPARSAGGRKPRSSLTIPARACDSWTTTIPLWQRKPRFRAANWTARCTFERPMGLGSKVSRHGWRCCAFCLSLPGSDASPVCRQCAGLGPQRTHLSRDTVTAFRARRRAVRPIRARFRGARPGDARACNA
jgi:hypothetical protein